MLHKVSNLTNLAKGGNENNTDNNQGEFGLMLFRREGIWCHE